MDFYETWTYCHQRNTWTPAPVMNLHILLNSSRVLSFFRRVLDTFKHDGFLWNLKLVFWKYKHKFSIVLYGVPSFKDHYLSKISQLQIQSRAITTISSSFPSCLPPGRLLCTAPHVWRTMRAGPSVRPLPRICCQSICRNYFFTSIYALHLVPLTWSP